MMPIRQADKGSINLRFGRQFGLPVRLAMQGRVLCIAHGRDHVAIALTALDQDGSFLALRANTSANLGAHRRTFPSAGPTLLRATLLAGQALREPAVHDADSGQPLTGGCKDHAMPRADELPSSTLETAEGRPCSIDPLGVKDVPMPATPYTVWKAARAAA